MKLYKITTDPYPDPGKKVPTMYVVAANLADAATDAEHAFPSAAFESIELICEHVIITHDIRAYLTKSGH